MGVADLPGSVQGHIDGFPVVGLVTLKMTQVLGAQHLVDYELQIAEMDIRINHLMKKFTHSKFSQQFSINRKMITPDKIPNFQSFSALQLQFQHFDETVGSSKFKERSAVGQ